MGYTDLIDRFDLSLVQDTEMRTGNLRRIIFGLDRENTAGAFPNSIIFTAKSYQLQTPSLE